MPPSPVVCRAPASAHALVERLDGAPAERAEAHPDTFTTDDGRNACARPRGPPSTLAHGSGRAGSGASARRGGPATGKVTCLTIV